MFISQASRDPETPLSVASWARTPASSKAAERGQIQMVIAIVTYAHKVVDSYLGRAMSHAEIQARVMRLRLRVSEFDREEVVIADKQVKTMMRSENPQ